MVFCHLGTRTPQTSPSIPSFTSNHQQGSISPYLGALTWLLQTQTVAQTPEHWDRRETKGTVQHLHLTSVEFKHFFSWGPAILLHCLYWGCLWVPGLGNVFFELVKNKRLIRTLNQSSDAKRKQPQQCTDACRQEGTGKKDIFGSANHHEMQ